MLPNFNLPRQQDPQRPPSQQLTIVFAVSKNSFAPFRRVLHVKTVVHLWTPTNRHFRIGLTHPDQEYESLILLLALLLCTSVLRSFSRRHLARGNFVQQFSYQCPYLADEQPKTYSYRTPDMEDITITDGFSLRPVGTFPLPGSSTNPGVSPPPEANPMD